MPTDYPGAVDSFTNPTASDTLDAVTVPHADQHTNLNDAVEAIETELGVNPSGASASVVARLDALDTTVAGKEATGVAAALVDDLSGVSNASTARSNLGLGSLATVTPTGTPDGAKFLRDDNAWATPSASVSWPLSNTAAASTTNQYATDVTGDTVDRFTIDASGKQAWGSGSATADCTLARTASLTLTQTAKTVLAPPSGYTTGALLSFSGIGPTTSGQFISCTATVTPANSTPPSTVQALYLSATLAQGSASSGAYTAADGLTGAMTANYAVTTGRAVVASWSSVAVTTTTAIGVDVTVGTSFGGTNTTAYGLRITNVTGTTAWAIANDTTAASYTKGRFAIGNSTAPTWLAHIQGGNAAASGIGIDVSTTGPTAPSSNAAGVISVYKGATNYYLLVTFNDAGTTRYRYMQLNGTTATWTHATTLPT